MGAAQQMGEMAAQVEMLGGFQGGPPGGNAQAL